MEDGWDTTNYYSEITSWVESGTLLYATNVARVEYELTAPSADMYKFGICHTNFGGSAPEGYQYRVLFLVDNVRVDTLYIDAASDASAWHYATTPWLTPTSHNFRLVWVNWLEGSNTTFGIKEIGLFAIDGTDTNTNSRQDWVENILSPLRPASGFMIYICAIAGFSSARLLTIDRAPLSIFSSADASQ